MVLSYNIEITHDSFLNYSPPKINFSLTKKSEKESKSSGPRAHPKEPANVLSWDNFLSNAKSFLLQKHGTISPPTFTDYAATVSDEQILHGHIDFNILNPINHLLISLGSEFLFTGHSEIITPLKGWPDHVLHDNGKLRSFIETKTIWDLPTPQPNETIIQWWNEDVLAESSQSTRQNTRPSIFHVIGQVYGYQSNHELKYGMLTNGEVVWFLFRPNLPDVPTNLLISPPISIVGESPTLFRSIMYFISLVNEGHISGDSPISSPMAGQPPTLISRGKYVQDVPIDLANNLSLLKERIGGGTSGNVFKYTMSDSSLIAVKCCDKLNNKAGYKMMKNEIKIYQMLSALQGNIIPYLRFSGFSGEMFLIGTTYIEGKRIEDIEILEKVLGKFKEKLALYNIEHGDLREQNILEDESGKHWVFDFGMSSVIKSN